MLEIELALAKSVRVSKNFCELDVLASSHGQHDKGHDMTQAIDNLVAVDNLGNDLSLDVRKIPSPERTREKYLAPPP
jgi:hypothetical protein